MKKEIQWFARGGQISKMGPFASQELAAAALITTAGLPIADAYVWPETKAQTKRYSQLAKTEEKKRQRSPESRVYGVLADELVRRGVKMPRMAG